jgi:hypothetical protein
MQAAAIKEATQLQIDALERQRDFVFDQLEPSRVNREALQADIARAQSQLALQGYRSGGTRDPLRRRG